MSATDTLNTDVCFDNLMYKAYGANLINSADGDGDSVWCAHWGRLVQHSGNHYILHGGSTGRRFVDAITEKVSHLAVGNYPSERVLAFSSVVLQRDRMVRKGADVCCQLKQRISFWREKKFDLLIQEASRCNQALQQSRHSPVDTDAIVRVFTKPMLRGKVKADVRWATERS